MNETFPPVNDIVVPAQAGVILNNITDFIPEGSGPRTGGGDPLSTNSTSTLLMWSPHRRG